MGASHLGWTFKMTVMTKPTNPNPSKEKENNCFENCSTVYSVWKGKET